MSEKNFAEQREQMVKRYIDADLLEESSRLTKVMRKVPREAFMPGEHAGDSYSDDAFPVPPMSSRNQTISAPYTYPLFYNPLDLQRGDSFLEVGAGSGYGAALAREMVGESGKVVTMEINPETYRFARENLRSTGYGDVAALEGDGSSGCPERAPFDKIAVTAAAPRFLRPLKEQLATPGKIVAPIGSTSKGLSPLRGGQDLTLLERDPDGREQTRKIERVMYVPLKGEHGM
ncbi:hypothetical protein AKJ37_00825 [candidate division MSBL1 archaeon SCGC-AAA259I09]|uniref:protein-L-isoaspartate(D-aspartate) O-methyltransferase n=1 Tax=candidate division MSBL1 archaeon SCGC-AAA259I09 TaxID=1698267 RepID=A0A133UVM2_9EURY|nr:hypothetical protein AKJ37_00825 [candidate division MSBL1 archaeon SCGC-AAA259I09]